MSTIVHMESPIPRGAISGAVGDVKLVVEIEAASPVRTPGAYADQAALTLDAVYAAARAALEKHGAEPLPKPEPAIVSWQHRYADAQQEEQAEQAEQAARLEEDRERERTAELYDVGLGPSPVGTLPPPEVPPWKQDPPPPPTGRPDAPSAASDEEGPL